MSGGPPRHPHGRQAPSANTAWNHLQVPNYFPSRQPQHAHMSSDLPMLHQPTWHTPTTEPMKSIPPHSHLFNLEQMLTERSYPRHAPGVDLTLTRNGSQNGDLPTTPISLSVRDTHKINSLPASALDIQAVELTKTLSPGLKAVSPSLKSASPGMKPTSPGISTSPGLAAERQGSPKSTKKPKRMDSILERLNPSPEKSEQNEKLADKPPRASFSELTAEKLVKEKPVAEKLPDKPASTTSAPERPEKPVQSVIVQPTNNLCDENSNSSGVISAPTPTNVREDDVVSPYSNEDSRDSTKSRRKRKPTKTMRVAKESDRVAEAPALSLTAKETILASPLAVIKETAAENDKGGSEIEPYPDPNESVQTSESSPIPRKTRRKTSSDSETIAKIAAMVQEGLQEETLPETAKVDESQKQQEETKSKSVSVSVITRDTSKDRLKESAPQPVLPQPVVLIEAQPPSCQPPPSNVLNTTLIQTPAQRKATNFVEVENKLEEMFAGIEEETSQPKIDPLEIEGDDKIDDLINDSKDDSELKFDSDIPSTSQNQDVTSTSNDLMSPSKSSSQKRRLSRRKSSKSFTGFELTPKKKKCKKGKESNKSPNKVNNKKAKKSLNGKQINLKLESVKDIYAYDSGSNASSVRSKGPFIQIRGPRDSPISVNIVNTAVEDDTEKKPSKSKKFHDDSEYRHKVRSKGLHCSTLSNKYDAQTRDISWICVFCKRGPHSTDPNTLGPSANSHIFPPGDLFGPYIVTNNCPEYDRRLSDPYDKQFKSKKVARIVDAANNVNVKVTGKKSKRKYSESDRFSMDADATDVNLGITETGDKTFEIWVHEDCVVWSPGVHLVGPKIVGLEEAVWTSCSVSCSKCKFKGANVCCLKRGCTNVMHYGCAVISNWQLDVDNYKAYCVEHETVM